MSVHTGVKPFKCDVCGKGLVKSHFTMFVSPPLISPLSIHQASLIEGIWLLTQKPTFLGPKQHNKRNDLVRSMPIINNKRFRIKFQSSYNRKLRPATVVHIVAPCLGPTLCTPPVRAQMAVPLWFQTMEFEWRLLTSKMIQTKCRGIQKTIGS